MRQKNKLHARAMGKLGEYTTCFMLTIYVLLNRHKPSSLLKLGYKSMILLKSRSSHVEEPCLCMPIGYQKLKRSKVHVDSLHGFACSLHLNSQDGSSGPINCLNNFYFL
jgi:hypothetical protein